MAINKEKAAKVESIDAEVVNPCIFVRAISAFFEPESGVSERHIVRELEIVEDHMIFVIKVQESRRANDQEDVRKLV